MNGTVDTANPAVLIVYFNSVNPSGVWTNDTGLHTGSCANLACHNVTLDWYGAGGWALPDCNVCHGMAVGSRRQIIGLGGDFAANSAVVSHHVSGASDPSTAQCKVCHDVVTTHMAGTVSLQNADTAANIIYNPSSPASLEPLCLSCHDSNGATSTFFATGGSALSPFNDGSTLGDSFYPNATRIAASWSKSYGHGPNGNHAAGTKLTCLGNGQPGTGCHGSNGAVNAHGSRNQLLAAKSFRYDIPDAYSETYFDLCFACHSNYPGVTKEDTFGVKEAGILDGSYGPPGGPHGTKPPYYTFGVTTHFADHNETGSPLNDTGTLGSPNMNLHWFHIGITASSFRVGGVYFGIVCINCHDVHGSNTASGAVYDEMGYGNLAFGVNVVGQMSAQSYSYSDPGYLTNNPTYCAFNCHRVQGPTKAWFHPITE